jgi:hypothetical protein
MPSQALLDWQQGAQEALAELTNAHEAVGGTGPGRRRLTQQLNYAYMSLLAAQFQGYCRGLHSQAAAVIAQGVADPGLSIVVQELLTRDRKLDQGNPNAGNIGADFGRFGFKFWDAVTQAGVHNVRRKEELEKLMKWRNAIAHDDIARKLGELEPKAIRLPVCRGWHRRLDNLVVAFDNVVADQCENLGRPRPW